MKITTRSAVFSVLLAASALLTPLQAARAQEGAPADARIFVDLRDASLFDALDMVFRAAGISNYKIDDRARLPNFTVGTASFTNRKWDDVVRVLANDNGFRLRNIGGTYTIDPKPAAANSGFPGMPGMMGGAMGAIPGGIPGGFPGANPAGNIMTFGGRKMAMETRPSPQILPGGRQGGTQGNRAPSSTEFTLKLVQHVYAGGIIRLFANSSVLTTREFLVPETAFSTDLGGQLLPRPGYSLADSTQNSGTGGGNSGGSGGSGGFGG